MFCFALLYSVLFLLCFVLVVCFTLFCFCCVLFSSFWWFALLFTFVLFLVVGVLFCGQKMDELVKLRAVVDF